MPRNLTQRAFATARQPGHVFANSVHTIKAQAKKLLGFKVTNCTAPNVIHLESCPTVAAAISLNMPSLGGEGVPLDMITLKYVQQPAPYGTFVAALPEDFANWWLNLIGQPTGRFNVHVGPPGNFKVVYQLTVGEYVKPEGRKLRTDTINWANFSVPITVLDDTQIEAVVRPARRPPCPANSDEQHRRGKCHVCGRPIYAACLDCGTLTWLPLCQCEPEVRDHLPKAGLILTDYYRQKDRASGILLNRVRIEFDLGGDFNPVNLKKVSALTIDGEEVRLSFGGPFCESMGISPCCGKFNYKNGSSRMSDLCQCFRSRIPTISLLSNNQRNYSSTSSAKRTSAQALQDTFTATARKIARNPPNDPFA